MLGTHQDPDREKKRAFTAACNMLAERMRTEKQLADKLLARGFDEEIVAITLAEVKSRGFIGDADFAQRWVESRGKSRGKRRLAQELRLKGVASEVVSEAMVEHRTEEAEQSACYNVALKKVGNPPRDLSWEAQQKLAGFLQRRGFGWDVIRPALRALYHGEEIFEAEETE
jgi:regulatory protein